MQGGTYFRNEIGAALFLFMWVKEHETGSSYNQV